ncbi:hypothetical protein [Allokutzneria albata]|uniref:hypothetical protein n=1 Tax=Allokutzneria albata TaxID=211114 RepID=UPI001E64D28E|nr:hypothetical protein [Allokutzneria albata]
MSVGTDDAGRPALYVDISGGITISVEVDNERGSQELAAVFARGLSEMAQRFAELCEADRADMEGGLTS